MKEIMLSYSHSLFGCHSLSFKRSKLFNSLASSNIFSIVENLSFLSSTSSFLNFNYHEVLTKLIHRFLSPIKTLPVEYLLLVQEIGT